MGRKKYFTEEERKAAKKESQKHWREKNPDYRKCYYHDNLEKEKEKMKRWKEDNQDYQKRWREVNPDYFKEYQKQYLKTPMGRAVNLVNAYQREDKKYNRGKCTLTSQWIVENIFTKPCHYNCGKEGWNVIGCDRIDNSLPHTEDNVIPCCEECNKKRGTKTYEEFLMSLKNEQPN